MNPEVSENNVIGIDSADSANQVLTFMLADEEYGVDILRVQEIKGWESATEIPNTPDYIQGVMNLRGTIVPIVDLRSRFDLQRIDYSSTTVVIVLKTINDKVEKTIGFIVDAVSDVYNLTEEQLKPPPDFGKAVNTEFVKGLATVDEKMLILLDIDHLVDRETDINQVLNQVNEKKKDNRALNTKQTNTATVEEEDMSGTLNDKQIAILEETFAALAPQGELLVEKFYNELFKNYPEVKPMFKNVDQKEQEKKLLASLVLVVNNLRKPDALGPALEGLGKKHQGYGAVAAHYPAVAETLLNVMGEMAGDLWTDEVKQAWTTALNTVANAMLAAYDNSSAAA